MIKVRKKDESVIFINPPPEILETLNKRITKVKETPSLEVINCDRKNDQALNYLKNIKLDQLKSEERSTFRKDGAAALTYRMERLFKESKIFRAYKTA